MNNSRVSNVKRNIFWNNVGNVISLILSVVSKSVFIYYLGMEYLGINGLFTNVLGLLAFSELGIGSAMNFSLYKPIAENNREKIKSLLHLYKIAYRGVAVVVTLIGLMLIPVLPVLLNTDQQYDNLYVYYLIYLFNTVTSYFVTYKYAYITALQKEYVITNLNTIFKFVIQFVQILVLILGHNFIVYLLTQSALQLIQKIVTVLYLNKNYTILIEKNIEPLDKKTKDEIKVNIKALIFHKIGEASVHQTDNILISMFINTVTVGLISNYMMLNSAVSTFANSIFNSFTASIGNFLATEKKESQEELLDLYNFIGFWIFGFITVSFISLIQSLFVLWGNILHKDMLVDNITVLLFFVNVYLGGQCLTIGNYKAAAGIFEADKWCALVQAIVNLIVSIVCGALFGLPGIYVGTIVQRCVAVVWKPIIVYRIQFNKSSVGYFRKFAKYCFTVGVACCVNIAMLNFLFAKLTIIVFVTKCMITGVVTNLIFYFFHFRDAEFKKVVNIIKKR